MFLAENRKGNTTIRPQNFLGHLTSPKYVAAGSSLLGEVEE